jgi:hypothetical protein
MMMQGNHGFGCMAGQQAYNVLEDASQRQIAPLFGLRCFLPRTADGKQSAMAIKTFFSDSSFRDVGRQYKIQTQFQNTTAVYRTVVGKNWLERESNQTRMYLRPTKGAYVASGRKLNRSAAIQVPIPTSPA